MTKPFQLTVTVNAFLPGPPPGRVASPWAPLPRNASSFSSSRAKPRDLSLPEYPSAARSPKVVILSKAKDLSRVEPTSRFLARNPRLKPWAKTPYAYPCFPNATGMWGSTRCGEEILRQAQDDNGEEGACRVRTGLWGGTARCGEEILRQAVQDDSTIGTRMPATDPGVLAHGFSLGPRVRYDLFRADCRLLTAGSSSLTTDSAFSPGGAAC